MSESRTELIAWYNDLGSESFTKVEQFGTGSAYCLIMDSIFRDVPLQKVHIPNKQVKFKARHEWEYVSNFKILQSCFDKQKIDNSIPVERLIKCKFQDNLEFLQWIKKFWDQYYPGGEYTRGDKVAVKVKKTAVKTPGTTAAAADISSRPQKDLAQEYEKVTKDLTKQVEDLKVLIIN